MRAITLAFASVFAAATPAAADYMVKEVGSFHVGGRTETLSGMPAKEIVFSPGAPPLKVDPNGEFEVDQMYVQYVKLAQPKGRVPLLLWHGGGLTGVTWETKPDGKPGWQQFFLNAGYDVYVSDAVERGRASWQPASQSLTHTESSRARNATKWQRRSGGNAWTASSCLASGTFATS